METSTALTIVGIAVTVVLGALALYLAIRYSRQVSIAYLEDTCLALFDDITQGISDLEIRFKDSPVSQNIVLLKGYIINAGKRDITPPMVEKRLRLMLPRGFEWIDCQITGRTKNLKAQVADVTPESIDFEFGLLKTQEYVKFDALATVPIIDDVTWKGLPIPPNEILRQVLQFDYRIADAHSIQRIQRSTIQTNSFWPIWSASARSGNRKSSWRFSDFWLGIVLLFTGIATFFVFADPLKHIAFEISGPNSEPIVISTRVKGEDIELYNQAGYQNVMSPQEFDDLQKTVVLHETRTFFSIAGPLAYIGLGILVLVVWSIQYARKRKYLRILRS